MAAINFTQYLRPDGRREIVSIDRPTEIVELAGVIAAAGFRFECEVLTTGDCSFTISDDYQDYDIRLCPNGPRVPDTVDELIREFDIEQAKLERKAHIEAEVSRLG